MRTPSGCCHFSRRGYVLALRNHATYTQLSRMTHTGPHEQRTTVPPAYPPSPSRSLDFQILNP